HMESKQKPPQIADRFLRWYCNEDLYDEIAGDLYEAFYYRTNTHGHAKARLEFIKDVVKFCRPYSWKKFKTNKQDIPMFKNYFKIAIRNILKRKEYNLLNASGFIIGMTCILFSILYLTNELRYDSFHSKAENIYRVQRIYRSQEYTVMPFLDFWGTPAEDQLNYINELKQSPQIEQVVQLTSTESATSIPQCYVQKPDGERFVENKIVWTNSGNDFFEVFNWNFIKGSPQKAFDQPRSIVLTESSAKKYFGENWSTYNGLLENSLFIDSIGYIVTGIIEDVPAYSHFDFTLLVNTPKIPSWGSYVYVKTTEGTREDQLLSAVSEAYLKFMPDAANNPLEKGLTLINLESIYLGSNALYELKTPGDVRYLWVFGAIGVIVLIVMLTNYFNLSLALYVGRQKEIGMRKVLGAGKGGTIAQFLFEALVLVFTCLPVSLLFLSIILPLFNTAMGMRLSNEILTNPSLASTAIGLTFFVGLSAGLYPALFLSSRKTMDLFKNKLSNAKGRLGLRRILVGFQFLLLIGLGTATYFINGQLSYLLKKDLGFVKEGVISINVGSAGAYEKMRNDLSTNPNIMGIGAGGVPGNEMANTLTYKMFDAEDSDVKDDGTHLVIDPGSLEVLGIEHPALEKIENGANSVFLINETAAKYLSNTLKIKSDELVGQLFVMEPEFNNEQDGTMGIHYTIDGILDDYHYFTLKETMNPLFLEVQAKPNWVYEMLFRLSTDNIFTTIDEIEKEYNKWHSEEPIQIEFLEERLAGLYKKEKQIAQLTIALSSMVIFLSLLGLLGLVSFIAKVKESEIGIRKVFGASVNQILLLLNKDFLIIVTISTIIATPLSYLLIKQWLNAFAYHIDPSIYIYFIAGVVCIISVGIVVTIQCLKAAYKNPVEAIKYE
ncbi:MAG: FtsX-like permease family protein, partial [Bacteroidota bacterium]